MESSELTPAFRERSPISNPWLVACAVFLSFLVFSLVRAPVPSVNEPHYLNKAKHFWNPDWCPGDFFLESANTHWVFYQTVGVFTRFCTLEQTAWLSRLAAWVLLAWGFVRMSSHLVPDSGAILWAMWMFLALAATGNWSGEWIAGGVEAKIFSYGFGFWAIAFWWERKIIWSAALAGFCVSFHPVVGGWIVLAAGLATLVTILLPLGNRHQKPNSPPIPPMMWGLALGVFVIACLPGIWPALQVLDQGDERQTNIVTWIQVFYRLKHHLDPMTFSQGRYAAYGLMGILWGLLQFRKDERPSQRWFSWFIFASVGIALIGVWLGYGERPVESLKDITWQYRLLKYYPFRLADIAVPLAVSLTIAGLFAQGLRDGALAKFWGSTGMAKARCWLIFGSLLLYALLAPAVDQNPSRMKAEQLRDWLEVCQWIANETPDDALVFTPRNSWAFKWYAQRAEYVAFKDCPQDAKGILEWNTRLQHNIVDARKHDPRLSHVILKKGTMPIPPVFQNDTYRIFDLSQMPRK